ncbi:unnamed protein product [Rotaria sordida]|uniref:Uncharacterized protein n=2 Tax=Rotaria sordida TaxID=392033 RepID=A0A818JSA1_9BILA|nr:unnamed protein product [Rotaria sordida]
MPYSSNPYLFERITREIVFSHLTASICQSIILSKIEYQSSRFSSNTDETKLVVNGTEKILMIDQHLSTGFEQLEAYLYFRFDFNQILRLNILSSLKDDLFIIGECQIPIYTEKEKLIDEILSDDFKSTDIIFPDQSLATINDNTQFYKDKQSMKDYLAFFTARHLFRLIKCHRLFSTKTTFPYNFHQLIESIQSNHFEKITDEIISTLTPVTLSGTEFVGQSVSKYVHIGLMESQIRSILLLDHQSSSVPSTKLTSLVQAERRKNRPKIFSVFDFCQWYSDHQEGTARHSTFVPFYFINDINDLAVCLGPNFSRTKMFVTNNISLILNERDTFGRHKTATLLELNGSLIRTLCWKETLIPNRISWNDLTTLAIAYAKTIKIMSISTETNYEHQSSAPRKYINTG